VAGFSEQFSAAAEGGAGTSTGGVGFGLKGLEDPNADTTLQMEKDLTTDAKVWDPTAVQPQEAITTVAAIIVDPPKPEPAPLPDANAQMQLEEPVLDETPVPTVDTLDVVKTPGQVDDHLFQKAEDLQKVDAAQNDRMDLLKENADLMTKPQGTDPKAQAGVNLGEPSAAGKAFGLAMPSPAGVLAAGAAGYVFGPGAAAAVAAVDTAAGVFHAFKSTSGPADVALKGQGTYSDARTESRIPQYGYKGKPQDAFSYASAKPIEQMAQRVSPSAPVIMDSSPSSRGRVSADDLWKTGQMADTSIRLGPDSTKAVADEMAKLRTEMDKTGLYADRLRNFANTPLDMNRDTLTRAAASGTDVKAEDLVNRQVLQVRPPQLAMA
jgi:hypothetical protein